MSLKITPLSHTLGARVEGVDMTKPLDEQTRREVLDGFFKYSILLFRGQHLTTAQHVAFSHQLGAVEDNEGTYNNRIPEFKEILRARPTPDPKAGINEMKSDGMKKYAGNEWHSDRSFTLAPTMASVLRAVEIPDVGGDTMFANGYMAYDTLSDGMKKLLDGKYAVHPSSRIFVDKSSPERIKETEKNMRPVAQPIFLKHPDTGRKSIYLTVRVKQIVGMTPEESAPLLDYLCKHTTRPQFVYRHRWEKDDLLMWDNRCTWHIAVLDYDKSKVRHMEKTALTGKPTNAYFYEGAAAK